MADQILVVTASILDQSMLEKEHQYGPGPLPVVKDLVDLGINLVVLPKIDEYYALYKKEQPEDTLVDYDKYVKRTLVPLVNSVMARVKTGSTFLGVLSYQGDKNQAVEPETSKVMIELFRLFDRNCMLTPYFEIKENLTEEEMELIISDIAMSLGI